MLNLGSMRFNQSQSSTPGKPTNGSLVLKYFLSETIHAQENGSRGTHFAKFLISNFLKGLTYSALLGLYLGYLGTSTYVLTTLKDWGITERLSPSTFTFRPLRVGLAQSHSILVN